MLVAVLVLWYLTTFQESLSEMNVTHHFYADDSQFSLNFTDGRHLVDNYLLGSQSEKDFKMLKNKINI